MKNPRLLLIGLAALASLTACQEDEPAVVDLGHDYFPQNIGHWIEYQVDSMRVSLVTPPSSFDTVVYSYPLREVLVENFTDGEGRACQRLVRYLRDENDTWVAKDVWWQTRDAVRAERSEENLRRVKLVFPPREGTEWNTNATNTEAAFGLTYEEVEVPFSVNNLNFESTVSVVGTFENNLINSRYYEERYARGVGMIVHVMDSIDTQPYPWGAGYDAYDRWYVKYTVTAYGN